MQQPKGLTKFIKDIRNATSKEAEQQRVEKELANIRAKFSQSQNLNGYAKKKYAWKLCYIYMLGYDVDFGHMEVIALVSSIKFSEKCVGYLAMALLIKPGDELMTLVINSIRNDLVSHVSSSQTLSLCAIANMGGVDLAEALGQDVQRILSESRTEPVVRKKAALCLLRLFRSSPDTLELSEWADKISSLLEDRHLGVVTSVMSLLLGLATASPETYEGLVPYAIHILTRLVVHKACNTEYLYYSTPSPWLQVKCLKFLELYRPPEDATQLSRLNEALRKMINKTEAAESVNKSNADNAILFEAVNLIISYGSDAEEKLRQNAMTLLGRFIAIRDGNIRYLALESVARLAKLEGPVCIQKHQATVLVSLKDADISVRKRALDVLFLMCDNTNGVTIVGELLTYLAAADTAIKEEMVLKIAVLAEKYATDLRWYVDSMVTVISLAGDQVSDDIWYRIVQIVTNHQDLQEYAAEKLFEVVQSKRANETGVCLGGYILGEFGYLVAEQPGKGGEEQFNALYQHFPNLSYKARALLLSSFIKLENNFEDIRTQVAAVFQKYSTSTHLELQQRAVEYLALPNVGAEVMEDVLREMPVFPEDRGSLLESRLKERDEPSSPDREGARSPPRKAVVKEEQVDEEEEPEEEPQAAPVDLLNLDEPGIVSTGPSVALAAAIGIPPAKIPQLRMWFNALIPAPNGILYEDELIQVILSHQYRASQGRIAMRLINRGNREVSNINMEIPDVPYLTLQIQKPSVRIVIGEETTMQVAVECMQPFADAPEMRLSFQAGGSSYLYPLRLPIVATSFLEPVLLDGALFMQKWGAFEGNDREAQEVFASSTPLTPERMSAIRQLLAGSLKFAQAQGLDKTEWSWTGAASLKTGTLAPDGVTKAAVGCMLRVEANPDAKAFRLTVRAAHPRAAQGVKNVVKGQLS